MAVAYLPSPIGLLRLEGTDAALRAVGPVAAPGPEDAPGQLARTARELSEYFAGARRSFTVRCAPEGTAFQRAVWAALAAIPYGQTRTYAAIAAAIGQPKAARAVGQAVGRNPCLILIPCHRVLAANGPGGFSCGLWRKEALLTLERKETPCSTD